MSTRAASYEHGRRAEESAAMFLVHKGCTIIQRNWRTRWCEIDIVATRDDIVYFCEVKYRTHNRQGTGLEYITPQKLRQMHFAAEFWITKHHFIGESQLCTIAVAGPHYAVTDALKIEA